MENLLHWIRRKGVNHMPHVFQVVVTTNAERRINVSAETAEEAQAKVTLTDGETVVEVVDAGDLVS